jgi:hypothetical protein
MNRLWWLHMSDYEKNICTFCRITFVKTSFALTVPYFYQTISLCVSLFFYLIVEGTNYCSWPICHGRMDGRVDGEAGRTIIIGGRSAKEGKRWLNTKEAGRKDNAYMNLRIRKHGNAGRQGQICRLYTSCKESFACGRFAKLGKLSDCLCHHGLSSFSSSLLAFLFDVWYYRTAMSQSMIHPSIHRASEKGLQVTFYITFLYLSLSLSLSLITMVQHINCKEKLSQNKSNTI